MAVEVQHQVTAAPRPTYDALAAAVPTQPHPGIDESPTRPAAAKAWPWACVARWLTVFAIRPTRAATLLDDRLTDRFAGVVVCARAKRYWQVGRLPWCWAHRTRDIQALIDGDDPQAARLGRDPMRPTREVLRQWSRCRDGTITRAELKQVLAPARREVDGLLPRGVFSGNPRPVGTCRHTQDRRRHSG